MAKIFAGMEAIFPEVDIDQLKEVQEEIQNANKENNR